MSIMIIIEKQGIKDVLITGKSGGEEKDSMKIYKKIEREISSFKNVVKEKLNHNGCSQIHNQ